MYIYLALLNELPCKPWKDWHRTLYLSHPPFVPWAQTPRPELGAARGLPDMRCGQKRRVESRYIFNFTLIPKALLSFELLYSTLKSNNFFYHSLCHILPGLCNSCLSRLSLLHHRSTRLTQSCAFIDETGDSSIPQPFEISSLAGPSHINFDRMYPIDSTPASWLRSPGAEELPLVMHAICSAAAC
jgi:hypothetical protein